LPEPVAKGKPVMSVQELFLGFPETFIDKWFISKMLQITLKIMRKAINITTKTTVFSKPLKNFII